jgi:hypothetical protein
MIALCQICTAKQCYLVDPFPLYDTISNQLVGILETTDRIKVMHGCGNDIIGFSRDFGGNIVAVIDTQEVHSKMMATIWNCVEYNPQSLQKIDVCEGNWLSDVLGFEIKSSLNINVTDLRKRFNEKISLTNLVKAYCPDLVHPQDATLADWRIRPLLNEAMIRLFSF